MSGFIVEEEGPDGLFGVFEDDGETGYLYVYEPEGQGIIKHLQVYHHAENLGVQEQDVQVVWSLDKAKCGVIIWNGIRGIIDLARNKEGRSKLESQDSPPITDPAWVQGFENV